MKIDKKELYRDILILTIPVMFQTLMNNVLSITDTAMMGLLSENSISGVSIANKIYSVFTMIIFGLTNGTGIVLSQYSTSSEKEKSSKIYSLGIRLCIMVAILSAFVIIFFNQQLVDMYVKDPEVVSIAITYLKLLIFTFIPFSLMNSLMVAYRIMGHANIPSIVSSSSVLLNILLNYIMIFGKLGFPAMGFKGAALATITARLLECFVLLVLSKKYIPSLKLDLFGNISREIKGLVAEKSLSLMSNELLWSLGLNVVFINYSYAGERFIPAITAVDNVNRLLKVVLLSFGTAVSVIIGKSLGKGEIEETKQKSKEFLKIGIVIGFVSGIVLFATRTMTSSIFSLLPENLAMAEKMTAVRSLFVWSEGICITIYYILRAGGDSKAVLILDGAFTWYGQALAAFIAARILHLDILWTVSFAEGVVIIKAVISYWFYKKENWLRSLVEH